MKPSLLLGTALVGLAVACALPAAAQAPTQPDGVYGAVDIGYHTTDELHVSGISPPDLKIEDGLVGFARLGYRIDPHWRVEAEGGYRPDFNTNHGYHDVTRHYSVMANVLYDITTGTQLQPFIGGGVGYEFFLAHQPLSHSAVYA